MKNLDLLVPQPPEPRDEYRFGTVTAASPVTVRFDGDSTPTPVATALEPVRVGERVLVLAKRQQRIVVGVVGGTPAANLDLSKLLTTAGGTIDGPLTVNGNLNVRAPGALLENGLTIDRLYGSGVTRYGHQYGYLIQTNLPAAGDHMWELDVRFNTYGGAVINGTGWLWLQGYSYEATNSIIHSAGRSTVGPREARAFNYGGFLCFWIAPGFSYETAHFYLRSAAGSNNAAIINVPDSGLPGGRTREAVIDVRTLGYDTGWVDISKNLYVDGILQIRRIDDVCYIRGSNLTRTGNWSNGLMIGTTPVGFRPASPTALSVAGEDAATTKELYAHPSGSLTLRLSAATSTALTVGGSFTTN